MRSRPFLVLSTLAVASMLIAGCSAAAPTSPTPTPTTNASGDVCKNVIASGSASEKVTVTGDFGAASEAKFELKQKVSKMQRTVLTKGDGEQVGEGDYVQYALSAFDGNTGERVGVAGYTGGELLPAQMVAGSQLPQLIGCEPVGTRLSVVFPAADGAPSQFYVVDVLGVMPLAAWGTEQKAPEGVPTVKLAKDGTPSVTVPKTAAPTDLSVTVLKKGDGEVVADGDTTLLQYHGVEWESGETFDSSWKNGAPISSPGNGYVPGFTQAITGQPAGTQLLVVIPPALAYGAAGEGNTNELAGKTLVFVIDILATQHGAAQ